MLGLDVPGHVRIVSVDGLALGEAADPQLTSLAQGRSEFAGLDPVHPPRVARSRLAKAVRLSFPEQPLDVEAIRVY